MCQVQPEVLIFMWLVIDVLFRVPRVSGSSLFSIILCPHILKPISISVYPKAQTVWPAYCSSPTESGRKTKQGSTLLLASSTCAGVTARSLSQSAVATYPSQLQKETELTLRVALLKNRKFCNKVDCFLVREAQQCRDKVLQSYFKASLNNT